MKWAGFKDGLGIALVLMMALPSGCDRSSGSARSAVPPPTVPDEKPRPTTQQLLATPFRPFIVPGIPVSIQAPPIWALDTTGRLTVLEGPTPTEDTMIQIAMREPLNPQEVDLFIDHMKREMDRQPGPIKQMNVQQMGPAKVISQLYNEPAMSSPKLDSTGIPVTDGKGNVEMVSVTPIHWMVTVLVLNGKLVDHYDINCIGMSSDMYAANKELLEKIMGSVKYELNAAPATAP